MREVSVTIAIDTEEDNWGSYAESGATTENIAHLMELQDLFDRWGARPTYLVNHPPVVSRPSVKVLGELAARENVEIGAHCHPWNTPPATGAGAARSMMCDLPLEANRAKISEITRRIEAELGSRPTSFRAGRWGFGPTVSAALHSEGYLVDVSVSPFIDWTADGGPDYTTAPHRPYRFHPAKPLDPSPDGVMVEIPTTVGFLGGRHRQRAALRRTLQKSFARRLHLLGLLNRVGLLARRWLSPETSSGSDMVRLAESCLGSGEPLLGLTFHSCTLLPGATPFVRDASDRRRFLASIDTLLRFCADAGLPFKTIGEAGRTIRGASA